jgi:hypothetical protein
MDLRRETTAEASMTGWLHESLGEALALESSRLQ